MSGKKLAFASYGVKMKNVRTSWSGISDRGEVVVGLWQDEFNYKTKPISYQPNPETNDIWRHNLGNRERIAHLIHARDTNNGRFRVVIMRAADTTTDPREVADAYARENMVMCLVELNETTGDFLAHLVEKP